MAVGNAAIRARLLWSSPTARTISGLAGGNLLATSVAAIGSLVQGRFVAPADLGYFRSFGIVTGYLLFLQLGLIDAMYRFYPYYIGKGEKDKALAVAEVSQAWNIALALLLGCGFLVLAAGAFALGNPRAGLALSVQVVVVTGIFYGGYLGATYRTGHDFTTLARSAVVTSVANLATLPVFIFWPYIGLTLRSSVGSSLSLAYLHLRRPLHLRWRFDRREWRDLVAAGLPVFIASYGATAFWTVVESTLILHFLGTKDLGLWTFSLMLLEAARAVPLAITAVYIPRITETFGRTESVRAVMCLSRKPLLWGTIAVSAVTLIAFFLLPPAVSLLVPKYTPAIPVMRLMMLTLPLVVLGLPNTLLVVMGQWEQQNIAVFVGLAIFILSALWAVQAGFGLSGIVAASVAGKLIRIVLVYGFVLYDRRLQATAELHE